MPKKDYEKSIKGLHSMAHGVFIPIFFASIGIHFSYGSLSVPYYLVPVVLAIITFGKFGGAILAAAVAKLKPVLTIGTSVMAEGAVDLAKMLSTLSAGMVQPDLFSLVFFDNDTCDFGNPQEGNLLASSAAGQVVKKITIEVAIDTLTPGTPGRCSATCASAMSTSQSCRLCMAK